MNDMIEKTADGYRVRTGRRLYTMGKESLLFTGVESAGRELLAAPFRLVCENAGERFTVENALHFCVLDAEKDSVTISSTAEHGPVIVHSVLRTEDDGCTEISLSVCPRGKTVAEVFGFSHEKQAPFDVTQFWLEIPLRSENLQYFQLYPHGRYVLDDVFRNWEPINAADFLPERELHCGFKEQVLLLGDHCGLGLFFGSDEPFALSDPDRAVEIERQGEITLLRIRLLDRKPDVWNIPDYERERNFFPLTFRFGMQTLPVRDWEPKTALERNLHIDCYHKIAGNYEDFLAAPVCEGSAEIGYDRLKRLGVQVLYLHEKWNDLQNNPQLTDATDARLRTIIAECHARGIRVVPYFGYEVASLSPLFAKYGMDIVRISERPTRGSQWYRFPYQRDLPICMGSRWADIFYEGVTALQKEYGFDGFYLDGTACPHPCKNERHGCGYEKDGVRHPTVPIFEIRKLMRKLGNFCRENDLILNVHVNGTLNLPVLSTFGSAWDGETFQPKMLHGEVRQMPEGLLRAMFTGYNTGVPVFSLCYSAPPVWTFRSAAALALLHGSFPKPVDIAEPLELMAAVWDIAEDFGIKEAVFHPYWENAPRPFTVRTGGDIRVSYYKKEEKILVVAAGVSADQHGSISFGCSASDAESGETITAPVALDGFDFRLFRLSVPV